MRDYLRTHRDAADEYGRLKEKLAAAYPYDIEKYCDGKEDFVKSLEQKALDKTSLAAYTGHIKRF